MTSDTNTDRRIAHVCALLQIASDRLRWMRSEVADGDITPEDAAAEINEILANLNAANK